MGEVVLLLLIGGEIMTRGEFNNNINAWSSLKEFCNTYFCNYCDSIYHESAMNDIVSDWINRKNMCGYSWLYIKDYLVTIPIPIPSVTHPNYYYYYDEENDRWTVLNQDDFEDMKLSVMQWGDAEGIWDEEPIHEEQANGSSTCEEQDDCEFIETPFSIEELFATS